ncbi:hypothetical protein EJ065_2233 [Corallococcus coralloides]|uniref:Lipoprotein n=1 Tax=Corallococcus coralloides TaxID=184914 RepID=A0A410RPP3_CORCK|nr:hypothetical protein [Corallococcus coralloides]QAT83815.1 hypothetical protein EJ065_2233 [Corallococcus coralloides]
MSSPKAALCRRHLATVLAAMSLGCATVAMDTETDCIQRHPGIPEACGLTAAEAAAIMAAAVGATGMHNSVQADTNDYVDDPRLPDWKNRCMRNWNACADGKLFGPCTDCLRRCEGQHEWPADMCGPKRKR